jgi:hypothetical protein
MSDTYYEYTFEFYIGSNLFYKASKLREELKNILKSNHSESITKINQITGEKEEIKLKNDQDPKRPLYSFAIGLIENKKNDENDKDKKINPSKEKRGLVKLTLRTLKELDDSEKNEIKKGMKFKAEINKRKKNNQYQELYKNRLDVIMESSTIKDEVKDRICSIKTSSPFYYDLTKINSNKPKTSKRWEKVENNSDFELPTKEELEEKIEKSLIGRYGLEKSNFNIIEFDSKKSAYITYNKTNKYKKIKSEPTKYKNELYLEILNSKCEKLNSIKGENQKENYKKNLLKTNIHGVAKFKVKFMNVPPEIMTKIMVQGLGGKAGIGMGFLWREEE